MGPWYLWTSSPVRLRLPCRDHPLRTTELVMGGHSGLPEAASESAYEVCLFLHFPNEPQYLKCPEGQWFSWLERSTCFFGGWEAWSTSYHVSDIQAQLEQKSSDGQYIALSTHILIRTTSFSLDWKLLGTQDPVLFFPVSPRPNSMSRHDGGPRKMPCIFLNKG